MKSARLLGLCAVILLALSGPSHARGVGHGGGHASGTQLASRPFLDRYRAYAANGSATSSEDACKLDGQLWGDRVCVVEGGHGVAFWVGVALCVAFGAIDQLLPD